MTPVEVYELVDRSAEVHSSKRAIVYELKGANMNQQSLSDAQAAYVCRFPRVLNHVSDETTERLGDKNVDLIQKWYRASISSVKNMGELNARWQQLSSEVPVPMRGAY